ncbi:hypothetical protein VTL71DRAFT_14428, partial [Oculimacula yallundae]
MLALPNHRRQIYSQSINTNIPQQDHQHWSSASVSTPTTNASASGPLISTPQPQYHNTTSNIFSFGQDQPLFDYQTQQQFPSPQSQPLMQSEHSNNSWLENGQLTPRSTTRTHHRESSLSSLGSAGPSSPYTVNTSNPQVVGDVYNEFNDYHHNSSKPLTPAHTPSQEHFLTPHYSTYYQNQNLAFAMGNDGLPKPTELMAAPEFNHSGRPSISSTVANESPSTPPSYEEEREKNVYRNTVPKLDRTMTDVYNDELYNPNIQLTSAPSSIPASAVTLPPQNDVFSQRLQAANSQHLSANIQTPLTIPSRERSPFRQGSPLAPTGNTFGQQSSNVRFGTAQHLRQQQKAESDARVLQQQFERASSEHSTPKTISPKDVDLIYHENEEDANSPLFPPQQQARRQPSAYHQQQPALAQEPSEDDNASQRSYGSMATTRRESSSAYSTSSQTTQHQGTFNFVPPAVAGSVRQIPQQYPFVPASRRQTSNLSNVSEDFPSTLTSMESSSSEYADSSEIKKPTGTSADTGTYTCTYHGCTLRFDSPAKLQRHKREGHRNSAAIGGGDEGGMTSAAQRNSQAGPHKCERINPSTGKPCNTIFSRPYDLTRHEDTIHNARKLKVHCPLCAEEKTFSRNDALTRHLRVVHPEHADLSKSRRRAGGGLHD